MRVLLVSPGFHGYHSAIAAALTARGHDVSTVVYDDHGGVVGRTWHQLRHQLPHRLGAGELRRLAREETAAAVDAVRQASPDAVVVVKGDTLGPEFWDAVAGLPRVTWLYDEVRRTRWSLDRLAEVGPVASYSAHDDAAFVAAGIDSRHLPLAYDHRARAHAHLAAQRRRHLRRRALPRTRGGAARAAASAAYACAPTAATGPATRSTACGPGGSPPPPCPPGATCHAPAAYDVMAASVATLNLHGDQDGFTMRTFEAAGVGAVQLVDRGDVADLYEPGIEVLPWTSLDELADLCRRAATDTAWADGGPRSGPATHPRRAHLRPPRRGPGGRMGHGLKHPADLVAWRRWHESRHPVRHVARSARARLRPPAEAHVDLLAAGGDADVLVAVEATHASVDRAVVAPLAHLDPRRTAVVAPVGWQPPAAYADHSRRTVTLHDLDVPGVRAVLAAGHYTEIGAAAFALAEDGAAPFFVSQHGALTPFAPPLPRAAHLLAWSELDARSGPPAART